jgi:hypothetical protein
MSIVVDESALYRAVGGRKIMTGQLDHLLEFSERENIDFQVVPFAKGAHPAQDSVYTILSFDRGVRDLVYVDSLSGEELLEGPDALKKFRAVHQRLRMMSGDAASARKLIRKARATM